MTDTCTRDGCDGELLPAGDEAVVAWGDQTATAHRDRCRECRQPHLVHPDSGAMVAYGCGTGLSVSDAVADLREELQAERRTVAYCFECDESWPTLPRHVDHEHRVHPIPVGTQSVCRECERAFEAPASEAQHFPDADDVDETRYRVGQDHPVFDISI